MAVQSFFDQLSQEVAFNFPPKRIVSLVPSQTELLSDLGLQQEVVGITKFCVHPSAWLKSKTIVGGTKNIHFDVIDHLNPDLVIGNKEENDREGIENLRKKYPVWMSDIVTLEDAFFMITSLGELTDRRSVAEQISKECQEALENISKHSGQSVLYLIWRKPWMSAGSGTFIHTWLTRIGLKNAAGEIQRYPQLTSDDITRLKPDFIFLSSEPYPFQEKHITELSNISPASKIILVDGEMFSWYGSRMKRAPDYFNGLMLA